MISTVKCAAGSFFETSQENSPAGISSTVEGLPALVLVLMSPESEPARYRAVNGAFGVPETRKPVVVPQPQTNKVMAAIIMLRSWGFFMIYDRLSIRCCQPE